MIFHIIKSRKEVCPIETLQCTLSHPNFLRMQSKGCYGRLLRPKYTHLIVPLPSKQKTTICLDRCRIFCLLEVSGSRYELFLQTINMLKIFCDNNFLQHVAFAYVISRKLNASRTEVKTRQKLERSSQIGQQNCLQYCDKT